jgi:hypothetical protein
LVPLAKAAAVRSPDGKTTVVAEQTMKSLGRQARNEILVKEKPLDYSNLAKYHLDPSPVVQSSRGKLLLAKL